MRRLLAFFGGLALFVASFALFATAGAPVASAAQGSPCSTFCGAKYSLFYDGATGVPTPGAVIQLHYNSYSDNYPFPNALPRDTQIAVFGEWMNLPGGSNQCTFYGRSITGGCVINYCAYNVPVCDPTVQVPSNAVPGQTYLRVEAWVVWDANAPPSLLYCSSDGAISVNVEPAVSISLAGPSSAYVGTVATLTAQAQNFSPDYYIAIFSTTAPSSDWSQSSAWSLIGQCADGQARCTAATSQQTAANEHYQAVVEQDYNGSGHPYSNVVTIDWQYRTVIGLSANPSELPVGDPSQLEATTQYAPPGAGVMIATQNTSGGGWQVVASCIGSSCNPSLGGVEVLGASVTSNVPYLDALYYAWSYDPADGNPWQPGAVVYATTSTTVSWIALPLLDGGQWPT